MSIFELFTGQSPEKLEQKGDALCEAGQWGRAKLEYENALHKLSNQSPMPYDRREVLEAKIRSTREALAYEHRKAAEDLIDGGYYDDALEMLALAMEVAEDEAFRQDMNRRMAEIETLRDRQTREALPDIFADRLEVDHEDDVPLETSYDETFLALCNTLPDEIRKAYLGYGEDFKIGYTALNRGEFQTAARHLDRAMHDHPHPESYIPLELASAYLNLEDTETARRLLQDFIGHHPRVLPAYQMLCEIFWDEENFAAVDALLSPLPPDLSDSLAVVTLKGETCYRSGDFQGAGDLYRQTLNTYGWNETVARELAKAYEALGDPEAARALYREMMGRCSGCRTRIDPAVKHKYAELSFAAGTAGEEILELYIALVREVPENAAVYFDRISRIYEHLGHPTEAQRFRAFSQQAATRPEEP